MTIYTLSHGPLKLDVSDRGGVIEGFWRDATPLLRPGKKNGVATDASCFPLVPFANRVSGNRFVWQGREYQLQPNVEWDAHYLHGDGWLGQWQCVSRSEDSLCLVYEHRSGVYHYRVSQAFHLTADTLTVTLSVTNQGAETLPFGTGWHPYFPLSPQTRTQAQASGYWLEREQWLAGEFCEQLPQELDFSQLAPLPHQWVTMALPDGMVRPASSSRRRVMPSSWKRRHLHRVISSLFPTRRLIKDMRLISSVWNR